MERTKVKLQTPYTFDPSAHRKEKTVGPSLTVPNESYTPRELYERFTINGEVDLNGILGATGAKQPVWNDQGHESDDLEKLRDADVYVREVRAAEVRQDVKKFEAQLEAEKKEAAKKAADKASLDAEIYAEAQQRRDAANSAKGGTPTADKKADGSKPNRKEE